VAYQPENQVYAADREKRDTVFGFFLQEIPAESEHRASGDHFVCLRRVDGVGRKHSTHVLIYLMPVRKAIERKSDSDRQIRLLSKTATGEQTSDPSDHEPQSRKNGHDVEDPPMIQPQEHGHCKYRKAADDQSAHDSLSLQVGIPEQIGIFRIDVAVEEEVEEAGSNEGENGRHEQEHQDFSRVESPFCQIKSRKSDHENPSAREKQPVRIYGISKNGQFRVHAIFWEESSSGGASSCLLPILRPF
jgi:hypothetical protein